MTTASWVPPAWAAELGVSTPEEYERLTAGMTPSGLNEDAPPWARPDLPAGNEVPAWAAAAGCRSVAEADALAEEIAESAGARSPSPAPPPAVAPPIVEDHAPSPPASRLREVDELRLRVLSKKARRAATGDGAPLTEAEAETLVRIAHEVTGS